MSGKNGNAGSKRQILLFFASKIVCQDNDTLFNVLDQMLNEHFFKKYSVTK